MVLKYTVNFENTIKNIKNNYIIEKTNKYLKKLRKHLKNQQNIIIKHFQKRK